MERHSRPDSRCHSIADSEEDQRPATIRLPWEQEQEQQTSMLDAASENIRNVVSQVQACIESTSMQLRDDYQHRAAVYQSWRPPTTALRQSGSLGNSPRGSVGSLGWGNRQPYGSMQQQESSSFAAAAGSFAEYFASRRSASFSNLDASNPSAAGPTKPAPMPFIQALVLDVRASREAAASGRPVTPLLLKRLLDPKPTPNLLLEKLRQQSGQQQQQGPYSHSSNSSTQQQQQHHLRSHSSCGTQNSAASVMTLSPAAGMPGVLSAGRGSSSVGELSLWSEPVNVSPVSLRRSAAALGSPGAMPSRAEGSFLLPPQLQARPQSPTVLAMLGTDRNIVPAIVTAEGVAGCCNADGAPCHMPRMHFGGSSSAEQHRAGCRTRSCSPAACRADAGQQQQQHGAASRSRSSSPQSRHLICCACRRQHSLQQHSKCCHLCGSCCKGRGTCGGKGSCGGSIISSGRAGPVRAGAWPAEAAGSAGGAPFGCRPGSLAAEGSASSTSTCPCVKAYRSGQRDGMPAESSSSPVQQTAGGMSPCQHQQQPQQLLSRHHSRAGAPAQFSSSTSGRLRDAPVGGSEPACASAGQYSEAGSMAAARAEVVDAGQGRGQGQDDLVQAAFLEVYAAQQNLMAQGPAADTDDIQELTQILQQVLPAAEPQHEALLKEVLARQQQLLALQERYAQEAEDDGAPWPNAEAPPLRLPSGLGKDRPASGTALPSQQGQQEQQQGPSWGGGQQGYEDLSARTNSGGSSNWTGGTSAQPPSAYASNNNLQDHLQAYMSQQDRLAAAAAAYGAFEGGQKPLQQVLDASRGTAGSRSSRGRFASGTSAAEPHTRQASAQQLSPRGQQQEYGSSSVQHSRRSTFEGEPVPAYTGGGSDLDLAELQGRPLVHFMTAEGGSSSSSSRHVVHEAPSQVRGSCPGFDRVSSNMRAVEAAAAAAAAGRAPSNRSIADSAWSVQATPPASFNGGQQQAVHCSTAVHAARDPEPWLSSVCFSTAPAAGPVGPAGQAAGGAAAAGSSSSSSSMHRRAASSSLVDQAVSAVVPPLNLGGALDTETAKLAGIAVDPRVMGLSPRLRGVDSASCLQELAAAVSGNGTTEQPDRSSSSTDAGGGDQEQQLLQQRQRVQQQSVGGSAPSPRTPGRHLAGAGSSSTPAQASPVDPAAAGGGHQAEPVGHSSRCASLSHSTRSASVRFQESSSGQQLSYLGSSRMPASMSAGHTQQQQQQVSPVLLRHPQDQQQMKGIGSTRAGSFELPDSDPSSQDVSYRSLEGAHSQGDLSKSRQRAAAAAAAHAAASRGVPAAWGSIPASPRPQQPLASPQHGPAALLLGSRSPSGSTLQHPQHLHQQASPQQQHACSSLSGGSSLLDLAARARVLASGGGSRHNATPAGAAGGAAGASVLGSPTGNQPQQQQQQYTQPAQPEGEVSAAPSLPRPDSSTSWRERQLAMQQELAAQAQQLTGIRSRASSVATTPAAPGSTLRSMSRNSCVSSIASSMAGARTPRQQTQQQQLGMQDGATLQQQQQQSRPQSRQEVQVMTGGPDGSNQQQQQEQQGQQPGSGCIQAEASCSSAGDGVFDGMLDAVLCDTLQQRREARLQKQAVQGWKQYVAARKAKATRQHAAPKACQSPPISQSPKKQQPPAAAPPAAAAADAPQQPLGQQPSSRPGSAGQALRISLQGLNRAMLKQSLGQLLEGQLLGQQQGDGSADVADDGSAAGCLGDSLEIVVSGQLRLASPPRQHTPSPQRASRQQLASSAGCASHHRSSGSNGGGSDAHIRRFDEQLEATRAAVTAAAASAGRAPLQGVLRDMHTMVARMEAVCSNSWQQQGGTPGSAAAPGGPPPQKQDSPVCRQQQQQGASQCMYEVHNVQYMNPTVVSAAHSCSPHRVGASSQGGSPAHYSSPQRLASSLGGGCPRTPKACSPGRSSPRRQAPPAPMPQQGPGKLRSPDRHKLRGRLHQVQDRLAKLEIKMNQASAMAEPCSCNAAGCVHRLNTSSAGGCAEQEWGSSVGGTACCCSLQGKRDVLVGRMQQELENLQLELANLHFMMPGAYSSSSSSGGGGWGAYQGSA